MNDVTERKRLEAQFIEAQKMEVVGQLAGGVAHDFNNILAVIMGYSELIVQDLGPDHPLQKYIEEIRHAAERAAGLTRQLLIFSRKQTVQAVVLDLNEVVEGMDKMLRRLIDENIEMTMVYGEQIGQIKADSGYVWQVLMNLVVNARDAMPNGGKLTIATSNVTLDEAYAQAHPGATPGDYVMLSVSDTGTGMTEEVKARLFEAFFTTKAGGQGHRPGPGHLPDHCPAIRRPHRRFQRGGQRHDLQDLFSASRAAAPCRDQAPLTKQGRCRGGRKRCWSWKMSRPCGISPKGC